MGSDALDREGSPIRVVVLCCDGLYQRYMVQRLHDAYQVVGVVIRDEPMAKGNLLQRLRRYINPLRLWSYLLARREMARSARAALGLVESLFYRDGAPPAIPSEVPVNWVSGKPYCVRWMRCPSMDRTTER